MRRQRNSQARRLGRRLLLVEHLEAKALLHGAGVLSGSVYLDTDGDGTRDAAELGVPGVVVQLSRSDAGAGLTDQSAITDDEGMFTFGELEPGTYEIAKRQSAATVDGQESTLIPGAVTSENRISNLVLTDDQSLNGVNFGEQSLRPALLGIAWFFASSPSVPQMMRKTVALSEEAAGNRALAATIRAGGNEVPEVTNTAPIARDDRFSIKEGETLIINSASGVLANDVDPGGATLTANLVGQPENGSVTLNSNGSFTYTPNLDFSGADSFTYQAGDATSTSNVGTVTIDVVPIDNTNPLFDPVVPGSIDDPGLRGTRMDTLAGAPPFTLEHVTTAVDFSGFSNAPSYGQHHAFIPGITPRPTGIYQTEQPDEDLVHNLEHGHVWISYNPSLIRSEDRLALEQLVRAGGTDAGVIVTPRAKNTAPIVVTSLTRQLTLNTFDAPTIRNFINTNRGHSPEGYIPSGQHLSDAENLDDGLPHSP